MKRLKFASVEDCIQHLIEEQVQLILEYKDEDRKQKQVTLTQERIREVGEYLSKPGALGYYRKDGIFYEIIAERLK
ncbi:hypothetical protein [Brevibacillus sp. SYSU BS000544]|uniref:hypothetical protein n=1 Tax=Brevibacillus sp. SYSU BS000544 TaxID=3416443 RepID=UPI003CE5262A